MSSRHCIRGAALAAGLCIVSPFLRSAGHEEEARKLVEVLKSGAPAFEKAKACQRLAVIGTKEAVPVLAGLLADEALAHYARFALEPLPDASVDEAFRDAMGKLKGKLLIGVINSAGARRDAKATERLAELLAGTDGEVAAAAAAALGRIGTPEAARLLQKALAGAAGPLRTAAAEACLVAAEGALARGEREAASALYDAVRGAELQDNIRLAGLRGAIVARGPAGLPLLAEKLEGSDYPSFALALVVARELRGAEATRTLVTSLGRLQGEKRALVIQTLGDRADREALPAMIDAAQNGEGGVRLEALRVLGKLGGDSALAVMVLLNAAVNVEGEAAEVAREALVSLGGREFDASLPKMLETSDTRLRVVLIELAGRRRVAAAVPALKQAADETDEGVRLAAIKALGETVGPADLTLLTGRLVAPRSAAETAAARDALRAACRRMPDRDACAETLAAALAPAPAEAKRLLLDIFVAVGGPRAVKAVSESVKDPDEGVRDAAVRALGEWRSQEAAVELLALYKAEAEEKERTRVFRGFNHIVRSLGFPKEERLALTREALAAARIDAERKELIETYANVPAVETFPHLAPLYAVPALKEDACAAAVRIGDRIVRFQPAAVAAAMKQVLDAEPGPETAAKAKKLHEQGGGKP